MGEGSNILTVPAASAVVPPSHPDDLVAVLLIAMLVAIIVCVAILRLVIRRELRGGLMVAGGFPPPRLSASVFAAPPRWLAVRSLHPHTVEIALGLHHVRPCSWTDALATPSEPRLFISPPVDGWIVVMGSDLPDPADDIDECFKFLVGLSHKLGEVQFFSRNRAVSHHGWARLSQGEVLRAYIWAGDTLWNQGEMTDVERGLRMRCRSYAENTEVFGFAEREMAAHNTERVVRIAAAWSLDPTTLEGVALEAKGISGHLPHWKLH